ncbi:MAG TPA: DUF2723 domain-containing protein, partial [Chloroflexota bacterium]|nr:DUF2723 domain-containing protein [Chloroflexota bacterium]
MIPRRLAQPVAAGPGMPARLAGVRIGSRALDLVCLTGFGVAALAAYAGTLAPDITWRNGGGDGAELATAAYVWGVAHPPGYPLYLTILRLAQLVPVGEIALRSNALSVVSAVLAGVCVCVMVRSLQPASELSGYVGASFGAAVFAFAPLVWSQAVVTEVYAFEALLLSLFLLLLVRYWQRPSTGRLLLAGIGLGLLVSHHPPFVLAVLPLAWMSSVASGSWRACLAGLVLPLVVALAVLATVALRASFLPWLNWGETTTIGSWLAHVSAASYRSYFLSAAADEDMQRAAYAAASLARQGGWLALALAALGLNWLWQRSRPIAVMCCGMAAFFSVFAVLYNARDSIVYLIPAAMVLALGAGLGAAWLLRSMPAKLAPLLYAALI